MCKAVIPEVMPLSHSRHVSKQMVLHLDPILGTGEIKKHSIGLGLIADVQQFFKPIRDYRDPDHGYTSQHALGLYSPIIRKMNGDKNLPMDNVIEELLTLDSFAQNLNSPRVLTKDERELALQLSKFFSEMHDDSHHCCGKCHSTCCVGTD